MSNASCTSRERFIPGYSQQRSHLQQNFPDVETLHVAIEDHGTSICQALPGKALKQSLLAPKAVEQQAESLPAYTQKRAISTFH